MTIKKKRGNNLVNYVWDTGALTQFFAGQVETKKLMKHTLSGESISFIPQLVFSEFYYKTWQNYGEQAALVRTKSLRESKVNEYILSEKDTYVVGKMKIDFPFLSIIDAIVATTAKVTTSTVITTDSDFTKVKPIKVKKIIF